VASNLRPAPVPVREQIAAIKEQRVPLVARMDAITRRRADIKGQLAARGGIKRMSPREFDLLKAEFDDLGAEAQGINAELARLKVRSRELGETIAREHEDRRGDIGFEQARLAALFEVAIAADAYLFDGEDDEEQELGDRLEDALGKLEKLCPGWRVGR
jgi:predicted  nucleic acid-binding Zn-ribbon protein